MRVKQDGGRLRLIDIDPDVNAILARPVFDLESAAAHAQGGVRADHEDRTGLRSTATGRPRTLLDFMAAHASLEIAHGVDGDREARACPRAAQCTGERRAGAGPRGRSGISAPRVGRRGFARGYPLDDRRRVERIAHAAPPHGAESCRGSRPASNAALFDSLRLRGNLIALALQIEEAAIALAPQTPQILFEPLPDSLLCGVSIPTAKPAALECEPLEAVGGSLTRPLEFGAT
jgi:hypothetical protein